MTQLTKTEEEDVVLAALGDDWRSEEEIASAVQHFDLLYRASHEPGIEFEGIENPQETFDRMLHALRAGTAKFVIDGDSGDVLIFSLTGERAKVNLSQIRMRRP